MIVIPSEPLEREAQTSNRMQQTYFDNKRTESIIQIVTRSQSHITTRQLQDASPNMVHHPPLPPVLLPRRRGSQPPKTKHVTRRIQYMSTTAVLPTVMAHRT